MLRQVHAITGMPIHATDGDIGHVHDVYFDDGDWRVRYFHVDTRPWFLGRHVLLAPTVVRAVDWDGRRIHVAVTREQVLSSPDIDSHRPVSRQHDMSLHDYFQWPLPSPEALWEGEELAARLHKLLIEMRGHDVTHSAEDMKDDPNLWSVRALRHYSVEGNDRELGRVDDFLVDPDAWSLRYIAVRASGSVRVNRFLVPVDTIQWISWDAKQVAVTSASETNGGPTNSRRQPSAVARRLNHK